MSTEENLRPSANSRSRPVSCIGPISEATKTADAIPRPRACSRLITCTAIAEVMKADSANEADKAANDAAGAGRAVADAAAVDAGSPIERRAAAAGMHRT